MTEIQTILAGAFEGSIPIGEAVRSLKPFARLDLLTNPAVVAFAKPHKVSIPLAPTTVVAQLHRFLDGSVTALELQEWAALVRLSDAFNAPPPPAADVGWFDDLWDVISDLACPAVFGPITPVSVGEYLGRLAKYQGSAV